MTFVLRTIETKRMLLRPVLPKDNDSVFELRSNPTLMRYIPRPICKSKQQANELISEMIDGNTSGAKINWSATLKGDDTCIGVMGFYRMYPEHYRAEIGYMLHQQFHGKGLMFEALLAMLQYGFVEMNLHTIEAVADPNNMVSQYLLVKTGFVKEAHFKENLYFEGRFLDSVHYTLHNDNWQKSQ